MSKSSKKERPASSSNGSERLSRFAVSPSLTARSIELFVAVARAGSMSAAAERLSVSQPAISQAIGALEASLGVQLFDRSVRPPSLTLQATALLPHAIAVLESLQKFENALRLGHHAKLPSLRIGMPNSLTTSVGPQILSSLRDLASQVSVDSGFRATRFLGLTAREFDFIITADESAPPPDVELIPILVEPLLIVVPASYPGERILPEEVTQVLEFIRFGRDATMVSRVEAALEAFGLPQQQRRLHLDTTEAVMQMVIAGAGWTVLPVLAVIKALARGEAVRVAPLPSGGLMRSIALAMRRGEGLHVAEHIRDAATGALITDIRPLVERLLPESAPYFRVMGS